MNVSRKKLEILNPKIQLKLFGYEQYFDSFQTLYEKKKLPNVVLLNGPKGLGKSTFIYHFINFILSQGEKDPYSVKNFAINSDNKTFKLIQNNIHPNFFLLENDSIDKDIKIEQVRNLLKFLNKSTYSKNLKVVLLDNADCLNLNSSNALLKALEEPPDNTYFFLINNSPSKISDTIKSRCVQFKFHFSLLEKKNIFINISENYEFNYTEDYLDNFLYFDTPGNFLRYLFILKDLNFDITKNNLSCILFLLRTYAKRNAPELLSFITLLIEKFYNEQSLKDSINLNIYLKNKNKIINLINDMKKFHLDKNNLLISINKILKNETQ